MTTILIATDGSPTAWEATVFGVELAATEDAELVFVQVEHPVPPHAFTPHETDHEDAPLENALRYAAAHDVPAECALLSGDTVDEIVAYADSLDVDLIVVGSRNQRTLTDARHGGTSRGVLHEARRPVLVVPASPALSA